MTQLLRFTNIARPQTWVEFEQGEWVRYADHAALVHALNNQLAALTLERDELRRRVSLSAVRG